MTRYQHLATLLAERIEQGLYRHGEKLPSVRSLSQEHGVSISTVQQAYQILETMKLITPQPRSGYFVAQRKSPAASTADDASGAAPGGNYPSGSGAGYAGGA
ncbi:fused DNA-binding transcriptional regulator; aminotransferase [Escherichia coli]|uniref:Fused DNA-binding transcriptional regulator aminotransferase n=1 Tax=Escherichia coli TaxID=562 RepID=A0A377AQ90_ECOLX|nr:fused DNA-binding transcriptional regulator; aminotransferase [Escherichia coli]